MGSEPFESLLRQAQDKLRVISSRHGGMKRTMIGWIRRWSMLVVLPMMVTHVVAWANPAKKYSSRSYSNTRPQATRTMTLSEVQRYNRRRFDVHNVYVHIGGGYTGLMNGGTNHSGGLNYSGDVSSRMIGGGGGVLGIGYEYNYKRLIVSVGPEFRLITSADRLGFDSPYRYTSAAPSTTQYRFDALQENAVVGQIMVPMMAGMQLDEWYWKAGVTIGGTIIGDYTQSGQLTTTMPGLAPQTRPYTNEGANRYGFDMTASLEAGVRLDQLLPADWMEANEDATYSSRIRVGLFADFGLWNMHINDPARAFATPTEQDIMLQSYHASEWGAERLNSLMVGVKVTYQLQLNKVREAKKYNSYLNILTYDERSAKPLSGVAVQYRSSRTNKVVKRTSSTKGIVARREMESDYTISAQKSGYLPVAGVVFHHGEDRDTARIAMRRVPELRVSVQDSATSTALVNATLLFTDIVTGEQVTQAVTTAEGKVTVKLPDGGTYAVRVEAERYVGLTDTIETIDGSVVYRLSKIKPRKRPIRLHHVYFAERGVSMLPESQAAMDDLFELLYVHPELTIRIIGYSDNIGSPEANQKISELRARMVRDEMVRRGIDAARMQVEGRGETNPLDSNYTERGRARNRRVEFIIML